MNNDDIEQKLEKISQIVQGLKEALVRMGVIKRKKSDIFFEGARNYALKNADANMLDDIGIIDQNLHGTQADRPLTLGPNGRIPGQEEYSTYHDGVMDEMPSPRVVNTRAEKAKKEVKTPEPEYPISAKLEKIIMAMPPMERETNRDSLASIQGGDYPPVKALVGIFTWTHDIGLAAKILEMLPKNERAGLLSEAMAYYKLHYRPEQDNYEFFNEWIVKDLGALAYDGIIPFDLISVLGQKLRGNGVQKMVAPKEYGM